MEKITLVTKVAQLREMLACSEVAEFVSFDTETNGLKRDAFAVGISFSFSANDGWYVPLWIWKPADASNSHGCLVCPWSDNAYIEVENTLKAILTHSRRLIAHNAAFDVKIIKNSLDIDIIDNIYSDTQLLHHTCIDEGDLHGLKYLASKFITKDADNPQQDLKDSVLANGGRWVKEAKEMHMGNWKLLGTYAAWDTLYTYKLFEMWDHEIEKQGLQDLWNLEVMPMLKVTHELNTTGLKVNIPYFEKLKVDMETRLEALEDEIYASVKDQVKEYERNKLLEEVKTSKQSAVGKLLIKDGFDITQPLPEPAMDIVYKWYAQKNGQKYVFNLDSGDDKAFLIYDLLDIPCTEFTPSGRRATGKALMDKLAEDNADKAEVLKLLRERSKEMKLLNTYVLKILGSHENGRIYPNFMQTGTTSGRYSCGGSSLNLQTLPRDDFRIKAGFVPDENHCFVAADYSSLEPRSFAEVSGEPKIQRIFKEGLDFYSSIAIDVLGVTGVSANPDAENYLGKVDKAKRQYVKAIALAIPYGAQGGKLSQVMKIPYEDADELYHKYIDAYPQLKSWMDRSAYDMKSKGYVVSKMGRKKRGPIVYELHTKYKVKKWDKKSLAYLFPRLPKYEGVNDSTALYLECRNSFNVAKNHQIQSLAASICNAAMVELKEAMQLKGMKSKLCVQIHDEIILLSPNDEVKQASEMLQYYMEKNKVTATMLVPMIAEPVITNVSLAEAK